MYTYIYIYIYRYSQLANKSSPRLHRSRYEIGWKHKSKHERRHRLTFMIAQGITFRVCTLSRMCTSRGKEGSIWKDSAFHEQLA